MLRVRSALFAGVAPLFAFGGMLAAASPALAQQQAQGSPASASDSDRTDIVVTAQPAIGAFGVDLTARDLNAKPGDDFERYASGAWMDRTEIPGDRANTGSFTDLGEMVTEQVKDLIVNAPPTSKQGKLYRSFTNEQAVERRGLAPLMNDIAAVRAIPDKTAMARYMGETDGRFGISLMSTGVDTDTADATRNLLYIGQSGLGLPDKSYYLDANFAPQRKAYADLHGAHLQGYRHPRSGNGGG